jgi:hypothetical protein
LWERFLPKTLARLTGGLFFDSSLGARSGRFNIKTVIPGVNAIAFTREERPLGRVSKDVVQRCACGHPSRRARKSAHLTGERIAFVPGMTIDS